MEAGIPFSLRPRLWPLIAGSPAQAQAFPATHYARLVEMQYEKRMSLDSASKSATSTLKLARGAKDEAEKTLEQIEKDVTRSLPTLPFYGKDGPPTFPFAVIPLNSSQVTSSQVTSSRVNPSQVKARSKSYLLPERLL